MTEGGGFSPLPEPQLPDESYDEINRLFYAVEPYEYFSRRLELLVVAAGSPDLVDAAIRDGVTHKGLKVGPHLHVDRPWTREESERRERAQTGYVVAESTALFHHTSETLLRFYLAHASAAPSPWIEIAGLRSNRKFAGLLRQRFDGAPLDDQRRDAIAWVFYGSKAPTPVEDLTEHDFRESVEDIERWLHHFASALLAQSMLYNSVKHGLTISPGESAMFVDTPADEEVGRDPPLIHADGPSVAYLERTLQNGWQLWHHTTRWLSPERLMAEIYIAIRLLKAIWDMGKIRYLGLPDGGVELTFFKPLFDEYAKSRTGGPINRMSWNLGYVYPYPPTPVCSSCGRGLLDGERARTWFARNDGGEHYAVYCPNCLA